jgi:DUF4097 and DUF4098 domain-containing protein YvlB
VSSDLELTVPRGAHLEVRGRTGDLDASGIQGALDLNTGDAGVRLSDIAGPVRLDVGRSNIIRAVNIKGSVEVKGGGSDLEMETITGPVTVDGNYSGELLFQALAQPLVFQSSATELRAAAVPGRIRMGRGDLDADNVTGPVTLKAGSKDVTILDASGSVDITVDRGDIELRPRKAPLARMDARTRSGNILLLAPAAARFQLRAQTSNGGIENEFGSPLELTSTGDRGARLEGTVGGGPEITLSVDRGDITVRKNGGTAPPAEASAQAPERIHLEVEHQ